MSWAPGRPSRSRPLPRGGVAAATRRSGPRWKLLASVFMVCAVLASSCEWLQGDQGSTDDSVAEAGTADALSEEWALEWSMQERLVAGEDGHLIVDNSEEFVQTDRFNVTLNFSVAPFGAQPGGDDERTFEWSVTGVGEPSSEPVARGTAAQTTIQLAEGRYEVRSTISTPTGSVTGSQEIHVRDVVVAALGDSFISGEGNPEIARPEDQAVGERWASAGSHDGSAGLNRAHALAHRSSVSFAAQAALAMERADPHSSVTLVFLAASGARIDCGLLGKQGRPGASGDVVVLDAQIDQLDDVLGQRDLDHVWLTIGSNDIGFSNGLEVLMRNDHKRPDELQKIADHVWTGDWGGDVSTDCPTPAGSRPSLPGIRGIDSALGAFAGELAELEPGSVHLVGYPSFTFGTDEYGASITCPELGTDVFPDDDGRYFNPAESELFDINIQLLNAELSRAAEHPRWHYVDGIREAFLGHGYCAAPTAAPGSLRDTYVGGALAADRQVWPIRTPLLAHTAGMSWWRTWSEAIDLQSYGQQRFCNLGGEVIKWLSLTLSDPCPTIDVSSGGVHPNEYGHAATATILLRAIDDPAARLAVGLLEEEPDDDATSRLGLPDAPREFDQDPGPRVRFYNRLGGSADINCTVTVEQIRNATRRLPHPCTEDEIKAATVIAADAGTAIRLYRKADSDLQSSWTEVLVRDDVMSRTVASVERDQEDSLSVRTFTGLDGYERPRRRNDNAVDGNVYAMTAPRRPDGNSIIRFFDRRNGGGSLQCALHADASRTAILTDANMGCDNNDIESIVLERIQAGTTIELDESSACLGSSVTLVVTDFVESWTLRDLDRPNSDHPHIDVDARGSDDVRSEVSCIIITTS